MTLPKEDRSADQATLERSGAPGGAGGTGNGTAAPPRARPPATQTPTPPAPGRTAAAPSTKTVRNAEAAQGTVVAPPEQQVDWRRSVETVSDEEFRRHPKVAGIVGSMVDQAVRNAKTQWERDAQSRMSAESEKRVREQMRARAKEDPYAFASEWLTHDESNEARQALDEAQQRIRSEASTEQAHRFAFAIRNAMGAIPEWREMDARDFEDLARTVGDGDDPELIFSRYLPAAIDKVTARRLEKVYADRHAKDLEREVEAAIKEREANRRRREPRPDLRPAKTEPDQFDPNSMTDEEFTAWYSSPDGPLARAGF